MVVTIKGNNNCLKINLSEKRLISDILKEKEIILPMPCAGNHTCGKCMVMAKGSLSDMTPLERELLGEKAKIFRLSCMTYITGDAEITLPQKTKASILSNGVMPKIPLKSKGKNYGFAVDIGTTTIAVYLYNLKTGQLLLQSANLNPQGSFGADVISRIEAALKGSSGSLKEILKSALETIFKAMCNKKQIPYSLVDLAVLTGNTTMMYLLLGRSVEPLSKAPFEIDDFLGEFYGADTISFTDFTNMDLYIPKTISAFVGSDITCALLVANSMVKEGEITLVADLGTNGEMALIRGNTILSASTAAGPAFEGAGITMGSLAVDGAINKVYLENDKIKFTTINGAKPVGLCGSGLIDAVATILKAGLIDETGLINESADKFAPYLTEYEGSPAVKIGDSDILLTQQDIRTLQLAKSAICAGIYSLINAMDLTPSAIDNLLIAGGFGSFIDVKNAGEIGLIPRELVEKATPMGNGAGMGASMILLNDDERQKSFDLAKKSQTLELSTSSFFMEKYIECMMF